MEKEPLRCELKERMRAIPPEQRNKRSLKACQNLIATPHFQKASVVMMYLSLPQEVDTSEAILQAWQLGKTVAVPKILWQHRHMTPVEIHSLEASGCSEGVSGLRNPTEGVPVPCDQIDLIVAPGLGFDKQGHRLGRGGSYYDRFFVHEQLRAVKCGFAFSEQIAETIPVTELDQPVDMLVTDEQILFFSEAIDRPLE